MIFLDANIFLRFFSGGDNSSNHDQAEIATQLLASIIRQEVQATTSEVVFHEVCFVLQSKHHYGREPAEIIRVMQDILAMPSLVFPSGDRDVYRRAFDIWANQPVLGFADSVIAARCERGHHELATFDRHFDAITSITRWSSHPGPSAGTQE